MKLFNILFKKGKESDILLPEIKTTDTNDLYKEYDKINVSISGLEYIEPYENEKLLEQIKQMCLIYPDRIKKIDKIEINNFYKLYKEQKIQSINAGGEIQIIIKNNSLKDVIYLNSERTEINKKNRLINIHCENKSYYEIAFVHEFGHVSEFELLEYEKGWNIKVPDFDINKIIIMREIENDNFQSIEKLLIDILSEILNDFHFNKFRKLDYVSNRLGMYAGKNYQEFLAESFVNYYCCDNPDPLAIKVVETFDKILNNLKGS